MSENIEEIKLFPMSMDPIYIGSGGFRIGRVDNTIVRDPITNIPKIPGSSVAGTWRYYMAMELQSKFKKDFSDIKDKIDDDSDQNNLKDLINRKADKDLKEEKNNFEKRKNQFKEYLKKMKDTKESWYYNAWGNIISDIKCAGQDDLPNKKREDMIDKKGGHCGHCIVCKIFGYSKNDKSWQGLAHFTDLNILFFPVYTRKGVKWITSERILKDAEIIVKDNNLNMDNNEIIIAGKNSDDFEYLNLGWLNFKVKKNEKLNLELNEIDIDKKNIVIVSDNLIAQIINSNLEVKTSVSIDPYTGASKQGALFTSEAIPRSTVFYSKVNIFNRPNLDENLPEIKYSKQALKDSSKYYKSMGIGGMTTRGFGRIDMEFPKVGDTND